ncbi:hypothetical protein SFR_4060 [Streptomyces sp. FR-008]|nr:hypothetical protein SFR_4060 [Streptomyces sp. FR-008]
MLRLAPRVLPGRSAAPARGLSVMPSMRTVGRRAPTALLPWPAAAKPATAQATRTRRRAAPSREGVRRPSLDEPLARPARDQ